MTEPTKTLIFVAVAILALGAGFLGTGVEDSFDPEQLVGDELTAEFDVEAPKRLQIVKFDTSTTETRDFEVTQENDLWVISSKEGYPADAVEQMADAATGLVGLKILRIAASSQAEHEKFGVVDPLSKGLNANSEGVGIRVTMVGDDDENLIDLIIGDEVKNTPTQRYVRKGTQDVVYVVELDTESLSTDFSDWIEKDLLKISPFDIRQVHIDDYSAELTLGIVDGMLQPRIDWERRGELTFSYDSEKSEWNAEQLNRFDMGKRQFVEAPVTEEEELKEQTLNDLRDALDDLQIVDVVRKPEGLSADLKAGEDFLNNREAQEDLVSRGFAPVGGDLEILSSEGEVVVTMKDGVEYLLRFGGLQLEGEGAGESEEGVNRYLFITARLNEEVLEEPEYEKLPPLPAGTEEESEGEEASTTADDAEAEEATSESSEEEEEEQEPTEKESVTEESSPEESSSEAPEPEDTETDKTPDEEASEEEAPEDGSSEEADDAETEEAATEEAQPKQPTLEEIKADRERIKLENQRKRDEYNDQRKAARQRVKELNERFGDWYYVIDNSVYKKIHLSRKDLIVKKEADEEKEESEDAPANPLSGLPSLPGQE